MQSERHKPAACLVDFITAVLRVAMKEERTAIAEKSNGGHPNCFVSFVSTRPSICRVSQQVVAVPGILEEGSLFCTLFVFIRSRRHQPARHSLCAGAVQ